MKRVIWLLVLLALIGCGGAMSRHKSQIREGLLTTGLHREAFATVWGMPDKTYRISSEEFTSLNAGFGGGSGHAHFFKGKVPLDVWVYEKKGVTLVFNKVRLIDWKTDKTTEELKSLSK